MLSQLLYIIYFSDATARVQGDRVLNVAQHTWSGFVERSEEFHITVKNKAHKLKMLKYFF